MYIFILAYVILLLSFFSYNERFNIPSSTKLGGIHIDETIQSSNIIDGTIEGKDIKETSIPWSKIDGGKPDIAINSITTGKIADGAITTVKLADGSVTADKIPDKTITIEKLSFTPPGVKPDPESNGNAVFDRLTCNSLVIGSDRRIKQNIQPLPLVSLPILRKLRPVRYQLKAGSNKADKKEVCGFIAQDIQETLPSAVRTQTSFISNICDEATVDNDILTFSTFLTSDLYEKNLFNKIKVKVESDEHEVTMIEVLDEHRIRIDREFKDKVFVVGQKVSDFMTIDSHQIFTVATAALQELDQKVQRLEELDAKVQQLELDAKVQQLELNAKGQRLEELDAKMQQLEEKIKLCCGDSFLYTRSEIL